jgi:hypothetical protein
MKYQNQKNNIAKLDQANLTVVEQNSPFSASSAQV